MTDSDHIMQLRQQVANLHASLLKAQAERDQLRRSLCVLAANEDHAAARVAARELMWDCFQENP